MPEKNPASRLPDRMSNEELYQKTKTTIAGKKHYTQELELDWPLLRIENARICTTDMASIRKEYSRLIKYNVEETYRANCYSWASARAAARDNDR